MRIFIFRHGHCKYGQGIVNLAEACDLTSEGIGVVRASAFDLAERIGLHNSGIQIVSSPFGRTLHTAKVIHDSLLERGSIVSGVGIHSDLGEIRGFEYSTFLPLVVGGSAVYEGETFVVDRDLTNPQRYGPILYFRTDSVRGLSQKARASLPGRYIQMIDGMESYESVANRFKNCLNGLDGDEAIIVTHEAPTGDFVEMAVRSNTKKTSFLDKGKYISFERGGREWEIHYMPEGAVQFEDVG
jgi:hypothetical protein